jgi:hypothetical protein
MLNGEIRSHNFTKWDAILIVASSISGGSLFLGILYQQLIPSSIGALLLSSLLTYYFQRRTNLAIQNYEKRKLSVQFRKP